MLCIIGEDRHRLGCMHGSWSTISLNFLEVRNNSGISLTMPKDLTWARSRRLSRTRIQPTGDLGVNIVVKQAK